MSLISQDYYTAEELAALKGVCLKTVYGWVRKRGDAPPFERFAGRYWFKKKEADAYVPPKRGARPKSHA